MAKNRRKSQKRGLTRTVKKSVSAGENVASKGVSGIYNFLSSGFNMGSRDIKKGVNMISKRRRSRKSRRSRRH